MKSMYNSIAPPPVLWQHIVKTAIMSLALFVAWATHYCIVEETHYVIYYYIHIYHVPSSLNHRSVAVDDVNVSQVWRHVCMYIFFSFFTQSHLFSWIMFFSFDFFHLKAVFNCSSSPHIFLPTYLSWIL